MALDLSQISFKVNTDELKAAINTMNQVKNAVSSLEQAQAKAATQSSKASKAASDAAKAEAQAALAAIKLEKEKQKAVEASADATVSAGNRSISVLEKQEQVLQFMVQGYSRGQSSILATAKAAGAATDELEKLGNTLQSQRTLMGSDPFDKSLGALRALKNEYSVVKEQVRLYNAELGLTKKQSEDLARDKLRLIEASKIEGKSLFSVRDSIKELNMEYIRLAKSENDLVAQYKASVKNTQDTAKANAYLETELQKVRFAVDEQNTALNRGSANALVRFENALKKSGKTAAEQKVLLDEYRQSVEKLQAAGAGRATDYISRAVGPQLTDIIVGLSTGQSLMTVMLQQGGQLRDQFAMMGVAGAEMGQVMRTALSSMAVSVKDTAKAFAQLFVGGVMDAGKAAINFVSNITGLNAALDLSKRYFAAMGEEGFKYIGMMNKMGAVTSAFAGILLASGVGALIAMGVALVQAVKENDKLAVSLALTGGSLGLVHTSAIGYVEALSAVGVTTGNATEALVAMGKAGGFARKDIMMVATAASDMAKYANVAVEDTVKQFAKLREKPVEALLEVAKQTGMVSAETIKMVIELEKAGKSADAGALAMKTYADVSKNQVAQMKENYNGFSLFMIDLGKKINNFFSSTFKTLFLATDPTVAMEKQLKNTQELINKYKGAAAYTEDGAVGRQVKALELQARMLSSQISAQTRLNAEKERALEQNTKDAALLEAKNKLFDKSEDSLDKQLKKTQSLAEWQETYINKKKEELAKQSNYNADQIKFNDKELSQLKELAKVEWDRAHKKDGAKTNKEMDTYLDTLNKVVGLSGSYNNDLKDLQSLRQKGLITEQEYVKAVEDLIAAQPFAIKQVKDLAEAEELRGRILGTVDGLGKDYYKTIDKLNALVKSGAMGQDEANELAKALGQTTPFAKAMSEWFAKGREAITKYTAEFKKTSDEIALQNKELDYQYSLFGLSEDQQKKVTIEYQKQVKLQKALNEYEANRIKILNDASLNTDQLKNEARLQNEQEYAEKVRLINRETAYQYAAEQQKAFDEIRDSISGSIVEALFNGGKSGTQKLRNFLVEQLKKPVTLVVNAVVNTLLGSVIGGLLGGSSGSGGGVLGSIGSSVVGQTLTSTGTSLFGGLGSGFLSGMSETMLGSSFVGPSATAAGGLTGLGATIGTYAPWIAAAAAIFSIISSLDDSGTYHTGGAARYSKANGLTSGASGAAYDFGFGEVVAGESTINAMETLSKSLVEIFDGIAKTFGKTAGYEVATAFADDTSEDGAWGAFKISLQGVEILNWDDFRQSKWAPKEFGDGEEGYKQYLAAVASDTRQVLLDMDLPSWADQILTDLGDSASMESLTNAVQQIGVIKAAYDTLVNSVVNFANITDDSFTALMKEFGGIENLSSQVSAYYDQYYTDTEKFQKLQADVAKGFADIGLAVPASREEFRRLAESQDLNTEAGRKLYAELMALATGMDAVFDSTEAVNAEIASQRQDYSDRILEQEAAMLEAQGRTAEAEKKRRELLDIQRARETERLMALNPELAAMAYNLWLLEDATSDATRAAKEQADAEAAREQALRDAETARTNAINSAYSQLQKAVEAEKKVLNERISASQEIINSLTAIFDTVSGAVKELYNQVSSTASMSFSAAKSYIAGVYSSVRSGGGIGDSTKLGTAVQDALAGLDAGNYRTKQEYDRERLRLAGQLALIGDSAEESLTNEQKVLKSLEDQIDKLDETLAYWKDMIDIANGTYVATVAIGTAIATLNNLLKPGGGTVGKGGATLNPDGSVTTGGGASFGGGGSGGSSSGNYSYYKPVGLGTSIGYQPITDAVTIAKLDKLSSVYHSFDGTGDLTGLLTAIKNAGGTMYDLEALSGYFYNDWVKAGLSVGIPAFANGGNYQGGLALVGEEGPELINFSNGGTVHTAAQTAAMLSGDSSMESRIASLERAAVNTASALTQIATYTKRTADTLRNISPAGDSIQVESSSFLEI